MEPDPIAQYLTLCRDPYKRKTQVTERKTSRTAAKKVCEAIQQREFEKNRTGRPQSVSSISERQDAALSKHLSKRYQAFVEDESTTGSCRFHLPKEAKRQVSLKKNNGGTTVDGIYGPFQVQTPKVQAQQLHFHPKKPQSKKTPNRAQYRIHHNINRSLVSFIEDHHDRLDEGTDAAAIVSSPVVTRLEQKLLHVSKPQVGVKKQPSPMAKPSTTPIKALNRGQLHLAKYRELMANLPKQPISKKTVGIKKKKPDTVTSKVDQVLDGIVRWRAQILQYDVPSIFVNDSTWDKSIEPHFEPFERLDPAPIIQVLESTSDDEYASDSSSDSSWNSELSYDLIDLLHRE